MAQGGLGAPRRAPVSRNAEPYPGYASDEPLFAALSEGPDAAAWYEASLVTGRLSRAHVREDLLHRLAGTRLMTTADAGLRAAALEALDEFMFWQPPDMSAAGAVEFGYTVAGALEKMLGAVHRAA